MSRLFRWVILIFAAMSLTGSATGTVINTTPGGIDDTTTQSEPHIAAWGNVIVAGWNDANRESVPFHLRTAYGYSLDGGQTWFDAGALPVNPPPPPELALFCSLLPAVCDAAAGKTWGDPVLAVDNAGNFYFATMAQDQSGSNYIGVAKGTASSSAVTFGIPVLVAGSDLTVLQDKPWLAVDNGAYNGRVYLCWTDESDRSLKFVRSTSTTPLQFGAFQVLSSPGKGCNIGVGPSGEVYVTWISGMGTVARSPNPGPVIHIVKSTDGGDTFGTDVTVAKPPRSGDDAASAACGYRALGGYVRVADWPLIAVDRSGGQYNGTVYIAFNAAGATGADHADVFVVRSPASLTTPQAGDPGVSWSAPIAINKAPAAVEGADPTNNDNWMPAMAVASNGTVAVSFYDRRLNPANTSIDVYKAMSIDRASTWKNERVTTASFGVPPLLPNFNGFTANCYMGDYNGLTAVGTDFHLVWGDNSNLVQGRPDPDIAYKSQSALCAFARTAGNCDVVDPKSLYREGMTIRFRDRFRTWIDPIERNCFYKWSCRPCPPGPGGLCASTYVITFDFAKARLDPEVVEIRLLDFQGREITPPRTVGGRTIFSFRPRGFRAGGTNEQMFFMLTLGPRGRVGTDYQIPVRLEVRP